MEPLGPKVEEALKTIQKTQNFLNPCGLKLIRLCEICDDSQFVSVERDGKKYFDPCVCRPKRLIMAKQERWVPPQFQKLRVAGLEPYEDLSEFIAVGRQAEIIKSMQKSPLTGYSFLSPTGYGKTFYMYALMNEAIHAGRVVYWAKCRRLAKAIRDKEFGKLPEERFSEAIEPWMLKKTKEGPTHLFLDEFDKATATEESYGSLFELIDHGYENPDHVVISITTNLTMEAFSEVWGPSLLRRLVERTTLFDLHPEAPEGV